MNSIPVYKFKFNEYGYVDLNLMANENGFTKRPSDWFRNTSSKNFIDACAKMLGKSSADIYYTKKGHGTWSHQYVALKFAGWLSPEFEVSMMSIIAKYRVGDLSLVADIIDLNDIKTNRMTNIISIAPGDETQVRQTFIESIDKTDLTQADTNRQKMLNDRVPDLNKIYQLPTNNDGEIEIELLDNISPENVILEIIGCPRSNIKTYFDLANSAKSQLALLSNENVNLRRKLDHDEEMNDIHNENEQLKFVIFELVKKINNIKCPSIKLIDAMDFIDSAKHGIYRPLTNCYETHLEFLRSALMDVTITQNYIEKEQLAICISIIKEIVSYKSDEPKYNIPMAFSNTSYSPKYFERFCDNEIFTCMNLDGREIMKKILTFPKEWKDCVVNRINTEIVAINSIDSSATHIYIYKGSSLVIAKDNKIYIQFATTMISSPGLLNVNYIGDAHLTCDVGTFLKMISAKKNKILADRFDIIKPYCHVLTTLENDQCNQTILNVS